MTARSAPIPHEVLLRQTAWLHALARALAGDEADDLVQETWLRALERPARAADELGLRAWLATVAHNLASSGWRRSTRRRSREQAAARGEALPSVADAVERVAVQRELVEAVLALEPADRDVVVLRYFEGLAPREIAERLGETSAAIRSRTSRALEKLRARLERRFDGRPGWLLLAPRGGRELLAGAVLMSAGTWTAVVATALLVVAGIMASLRWGG